jgi:iron(III) transport system substrate-binding protein
VILRLAGVGVLLALILAVPFLLRPSNGLLAPTDETLVIVSPHNEAVREEFGRAFEAFYRQDTGRSIRVDWRVPGGTSEIARYLNAEYLAAFEYEWRRSGRAWSHEISEAFDNPSILPARETSGDSPAQAARRSFLQSRTGIGIDVFFGGGAYDFQQQAKAGRLVPSEILATHPEWFNDDSIPLEVSGEPFYDPAGLWFGACLSSFGMCFNTDTLERLGVRSLPANWSDLADPVYFRNVALADPTKSGSAARAFEMVVQQQMQDLVRESGSDDLEILALGWTRGLQLIQAASANARYFTDSATKIPLDVSQGDAAIGMCIDFYGRFQSEAVQVGSSPSRLQYLTPVGGSSVGVDPVAILRGAPNPAAAEAFVKFVLSLEGQKLWNFKVGVPGGPHHYALRRLPVRKELYAPEWAAFRSDPGVQPYEDAKQFDYHPKWTASLLRVLAFVIRVACLDLHDEQSAAWQALAKAGFPRDAYKMFTDFSGVDYQRCLEEIRPILSARDKIQEVRLAKELSDEFRSRYLKARQMAETPD